jgi:hypothetical protein
MRRTAPLRLRTFSCAEPNTISARYHLGVLLENAQGNHRGDQGRTDGETTTVSPAHAPCLQWPLPGLFPVMILLRGALEFRQNWRLEFA